MKLAQEAMAKDRLGEAMALLNRHRPLLSTLNSGLSSDLRGWEWRYLWGQCQGDPAVTLFRRTNEVFSLTASPDGNWLAVGELGSNKLSIWSLQRREEAARLPTGNYFVHAAFSPSGALLAFSTSDSADPTNQQHCVRFWDGAIQKLLPGELTLAGPCAGLAFSGDGRTLVTCTRPTDAPGGGQITLWQLPEGRMLVSHATQPDPLRESVCNQFAVAGDLSVAAYGVSAGGPPNSPVSVMDLATGKELWTRESTDMSFSAFAISPDGNLLAASNMRGVLHLWRAPLWAEIEAAEREEAAEGLNR